MKRMTNELTPPTIFDTGDLTLDYGWSMGWII